MNRMVVLATFVALMVSLLTACNQAGPTPEITPDPGATATATGTSPAGVGATPTELASPTAVPSPTEVPARPGLPTTTVTFTVHAPEPPDGEPVFLLLLPFIDHQWTAANHVQLEERGDGTWRGSAELPQGGLVRYVYDHWQDEQFENFKTKREAHGESVEIYSRFLYVEPGMTSVEDTVDTWADARVPAQRGAVAGVVVDASTGEPIVDANVSIGGLHLASDYEGRFVFQGVAAGPQRATAFTTLGDYKAASAIFDVLPGETTDIRVEMTPARPVEVALEVHLPPETPEQAEIRVLGSQYEMGARAYFPNQPLMGSGLFAPALQRTSGNRATITLNLYSGTYVEYFYSIGGLANQERDAENGSVVRNFIVGEVDSTVVDEVDRWKPDYAGQMAVRVTVPPNTPAGVPVYLDRGPHGRMTQVGPFEWMTWIDGFPGETIEFGVTLGGMTPDADGRKSVLIAEAGGEASFTVRRWERFSAVSAVPLDGAVETTINVSVPTETAEDTAVSIEFEPPGAADAVTLSHVGGNLWTGSVELPAGAVLSYRVVEGASGESGPARTLIVPLYAPYEVNDWVTAWSVEGGAPGERDGFIAGFFPPDFWSESFRDLSATTFDSIAAHNGNWVALSSVWSYGTIRPLPTIESRPLESGSVYTPRVEILRQADAAHDAGLSVLLVPQFNMEMSDGGLDALADNDEEWWDAWLLEARKFWMWNAHVAEEVGAEALLLPGFVFHVYASPGFMPSQEYFEEFDQQLVDLLQDVRAVYGGKLLVSGGVRESQLPGAADLVGVTTYDTGHPNLPADAPLQDWVDAYEQIFVERVDPRWEAWGVPVLFYTVHSPSPGGDRLLQAKRLEAIYQVIARRPWIAGTFSWAYDMVGTAAGEHDGVRDRPAEAVLAKWYGLFTGRD